MIVSHVVAMSENRVIGQGGGLPWHIPGDLKRFKAVTMGKIVLMGRKTYASIGRPLPGRLNIVVTRSIPPEGTYPSDVIVCSSLDDAFKYAASVAPEWQNEVCVIGGGDIYRQTLSKVEQVYLSHVQMTVMGDTYYPELPSGFKCMEKEDYEGSPAFSWCRYQMVHQS
jgi:dihydrofolate reductase